MMMVYRDGDYFVPQGNTELKVGDKLLVISDRGEELESTYKDMGVDEVLKLEIFPADRFSLLSNKCRFRQLFCFEYILKIRSPK